MATQDLTLKMWLVQELKCKEIEGDNTVFFSEDGWYLPSEASATSVENAIVPNYYERIRLQLTELQEVNYFTEMIASYYQRCRDHLLNFASTEVLGMVLARSGGETAFAIKNGEGTTFAVTVMIEPGNILNVLIIASDGETNCANLQLFHQPPR